MSPNSSSTCLIGQERPLGGTADPFSLPPPVAIGGLANSTPCVPRMPPTTGRGTLRGGRQPARHRRWYRGPNREGEACLSGGPAPAPPFRPHASRYGKRARRARGSRPGGSCAALFAGGCGGGARQDAHEPKGSFQPAGPPRELPRQAVDRAAGRARTAGAKQRHPRGTERGGHDRLLLLHRKLPRTGRRQATGVGHRTGARDDPPAPRAQPGRQPAGAGRRPT